MGLLSGSVLFANAYTHLGKLRDTLLVKPALVGLLFVDESSELVHPAGHVVTGDLLAQESCQLARSLDGTKGRDATTVASEQREVHQFAPAGQVWRAEIGLIS